MKLPPRIYLVGFMGSGKSHSGKLLATALGYEFADLDDLIVLAVGCSIASLFESKGEAFFRELEKQKLHETALLNRCVIACGGGTPCFFDNMEWINSRGVSIYLKASPTLLAKRLSAGQEQRPVLRQAGTSGLEEFIALKLKERQPFYEQAHWIYDQDEEAASLAEFVEKRLMA